MKLEICVKPERRHYQVWMTESDTDWTLHLGSTSAEDVAALIDRHTQRLLRDTAPEVVVIDDNREPVAMPTELNAALDALRRKAG